MHKTDIDIYECNPYSRILIKLKNEAEHKKIITDANNQNFITEYDCMSEQYDD